MATDVTGVEDVMGEAAHFWQLRKFQFIEEATDFWMNAVAPKECFGDEDPDLDTTLLLNQFFTEWLLFEMPYQESTLVGITALRDEISAESRNVLKQIAETQRFSSFKMQWLNPDTSMVQLRDVYSGKCYIVESALLADKAGWPAVLPMLTGVGAARDRCFCTMGPIGTRSIRAITFRLIHMAIMSDCVVKFSGGMENIVKAFSCTDFLKRGDLVWSPLFSSIDACTMILWYTNLTLSGREKGTRDVYSSQLHERLGNYGSGQVRHVAGCRKGNCQGYSKCLRG